MVTIIIYEDLVACIVFPFRGEYIKENKFINASLNFFSTLISPSKIRKLIFSRYSLLMIMQLYLHQFSEVRVQHWLTPSK